MSMNPFWQLLGLLLLIIVFVSIHRSSRYAEEDISPIADMYQKGGTEIWPLSLIVDSITDARRINMQIPKVNVQQYLSPDQRNEFYINSMKVERKGKVISLDASNNKHSDGRTNVKAFNRIHSGFSAKG
jgi:hypothetical protein